MATMNVKNAAGETEAIEKPLAPGRAAATASRPVVLSTEDKAVLDDLSTKLSTLAGHVDGLEALAGALNGYVDGIEALITATNAALGSLSVSGPLTDAQLRASAVPTSVSSQPARTATTDNIGAKLGTDAIMNGTTALTPKFAVIAASSSGDNQIVAAVSGKKIRVLAYNMVANGAVNAKFQSDATDKTGLKYFDAAGAGICAPFNPVGWFETVAGEKLDLNLSGAVAVGGELVYVEV